MISQWIRVLHSDNGVLTDYTLACQNSDTIPLPLVAAEDSILVGTHFPVNHLFFDVNTANANAAEIQTQLWDGTAYQDNVDHLDETSVGGVMWARSGGLIFSPDRQKRWNIVQDTKDVGPTELITKNIYNLHWLKIKPSADLSVGTILNGIRYRFATTQMLQVLDPDMDDYLASWGVSDWDDQLVAASDYVIADMQARGVIIHPGQILRMNEIALATAYRALIMIYTVLGDPLLFRLNEAKSNYTDLMKIKRFTIDQNADGMEQEHEVSNMPTGVGVR